MNSQAMWNARYAAAADTESSVWSLSPNAWIAERVGALVPGTAVDLACGEGRNALWLAERGWQVTAVDFAAAAIDTGRRRSAAIGVDIEWVVADATTWVSPSLVDLVVIAYLQLETSTIAEVIAAASGWLEPGGRLVLIGHDVDNLDHGVGGPQRAEILWDIAQLRAAAGDLEIEQCERVHRAVDGGTAIDAVLVARRS